MQQRVDINKNERLQIRTDKYSKNLLQKASLYTHKKVSEFVLNSSIKAAQQVIEEYEKTHLSDTDWSLFYNALLNPQKPNAKLKKAIDKYKQKIGE